MSVKDHETRPPFRDALRRSEDRFRLMVEGSEEVFFYEHDSAHRFTYLSPSVKNVTGYEPSELLGRPYDVLLTGDPEDHVVQENTERALLTGRRQGGYRATIRHKDGRDIVLEIVESPLEPSDGPRYMHGFARDVTERHTAEAALRRRLDAEVALARVSTLLTSAGASRLDGVLRTLGGLVDASRAYVITMWDGGRRLDDAHEWCAPGVAPQLGGLEELTADAFPWWMARLRRGESIHVPDIRDLPAEAVRERETLEAQDVRSVLVVPLSGREGELLGFMGFDDVRRPRPWCTEDVRVLRLAAEMVAGDVQRRRTEEALRRSEEYFRALIEDAPNLIMVVGGEGTARYVSPAYGDVLGYEEHELKGCPVFEVVHPEDRPVAEAAFRDLMTDPGGSVSMEARVRHADGTWRVLAGTVKNLLAVPAVNGLVVNSLDVTERRRSEQQLRLLSRAVEASPASIVITEPEGTIVYVNPKFTETTGYAPDEVLGRNPHILRSGQTDPEVYRELWETITGGREWHGELQSRRKDGSFFREMVSISPVLAADGTITHYVAVKEDVTERRLLQATVEQAQRMQMVGRLAGGVAHDINNVLTAIGGYAGFVLDRLPEDDPLRDDVEEIVRAGSRAAAVVGQLLTFSRRNVAKTEIVDVNEVTGGIQRMLELLIGEHIRLSVSLHDGPATVRADRTQLEQVLVNLAVNGRDAMPDGGELSICVDDVRLDGAPGQTLERDVEPGDYVVVTVRDTGTGIPPDARDHLFEPFFTTKPVGKGTGLGLATVYGIVKGAGGHVEFHTRVASGTTFRVFLPAVDGRPEPVTPSRGERVGGTEGILLVEDDAAVRNVARRILDSAGYDVVEAGNGREALEIVEEDSRVLDLVLTDTVMPELGGHELAALLAERRPDLTVLLMSGYALDEMSRGGPAADGEPRVEMLRKPFEASELLERVREALDRPD